MKPINNVKFMNCDIFDQKTKDNIKNFCERNLGKTSLFLSEKLPKEVTFFINKA